MKNIIAVIFDFDDTLAPDSTSFFLESMGVDVPHFWRDTVDPLIDEGWDPIPALMYRLLECSKNREAGRPFTRASFNEAGKKLKFFPGVTTFFQTLRDLSAELSNEINIAVELEYYVISSGLLPIIGSTRIARHFTEIWASDFLYGGPDGEIVFPKNFISFTDKTRFLFHIQKGIIGPQFRNKPFEVNKKTRPEDIRIPFDRMIFVGDGYTDVPCFSLMQRNGGTAIAVYDRNRREKWGRAWGFTQTGRATNIAPSDYRKKSALHDSLIMAIERICHDIALSNRTYRS